MTNPVKAIAATVELSDNLSIDGYMLPDGNFRAPIYALRLLKSKDLKTLLEEAYTGYSPDR